MERLTTISIDKQVVCESLNKLKGQTKYTKKLNTIKNRLRNCVVALLHSTNFYAQGNKLATILS